MSLAQAADFIFLFLFFHLAKLYPTILRDKRLREKAAEQQFLFYIKDIPLVKSKYS